MGVTWSISKLKKVLVGLYDAQPLFLDRLPYTPEFDTICQVAYTQCAPPTVGTPPVPAREWQRTVWITLLEMRKSDRMLPRKTSKKVHVTPGGKGNPVKGKPLPAGPSLTDIVGGP
jgi:hypothetical protein